jgi:SAM-dependent methyltransferase
MKQILHRLYNSSPKEILQRIRKKMGASSRSAVDEAKVKEVSDQLRKVFGAYTTSNLRSISAEEFSAHIQSCIGVIDASIEGYADDEVERQRDVSVKFHWGHDHDFGTFKLQGRMRDRHIYLLAHFMALFPITTEDFRDKAVLDIGCWTGGTTLLLAGLAQKVVAIEEVRKYAEMTTFLSKSFGLEDRVSVKPVSVYGCNTEEFHGRFDIVYFPGVIYHVSDPVVALRILFNSLKPGGFILVESAGMNREEPFCRFDGSRIYHMGTRKDLNRGGWNWFTPSPSALDRMMKEAGFEETQVRWYDGTERIYAYGKKRSQAPICRAGLSVPGIK